VSQDSAGSLLHVSWRWTEWTTLIMSGLVLGLVVLFQPEIYPPTLLKWKAGHLRAVTGDKWYVSDVEIRGDSFLKRLETALYRHFLLTTPEPVIMLLALYLTVIYIVLFTFLDGYNYIFWHDTRNVAGDHWSSIFGDRGGVVWSFCVPLIYEWAKRDLKKVQEKGIDCLLGLGCGF